MINLSELFDPLALGIVASGTAIGTLARSGWRGAGVVLRETARLFSHESDMAQERALLADCARQIRRDGVIRADFRSPADPELAALTANLARHRNLDRMIALHQAQQRRHKARTARAVGVFEAAGDLAPVFGLVGTLIGITQMGPGVLDEIDGLMASLSTAVLSTLYGVVIAHILCFPLAMAIDRRATRESERREELVRWFERQVRDACPPAGEGAGQAAGQIPLRVA